MPKATSIFKWIDETFDGETFLLADGFEEAFIGVGESFTNPMVAVYDKGKCLDILMTRDGMSWDEAVEFFEFNVTGAYVGPQTPMFVSMFKPQKSDVN